MKLLRPFIPLFLLLAYSLVSVSHSARISTKRHLSTSRDRPRVVATIEDDPHFTTPDGVAFDFHGDLNTTYCFVSSANFHINTLLQGYRDKRAFGASAPDANGLKLRTWMKQTAFMWVDEKGANHTFLLAVRISKESERGKGYLDKVSLDGEDLGLPYDGKPVKGFGLEFKFTGVKAQEKPKEEKERFSLKIENAFEGGVTIRPANPQLQTEDDAEIHLNFNILSIWTTDAIEGVMGQFFRDGNSGSAKAEKWREITETTGKPIQADQESGKGWLEGTVHDYVSSDITTPDCKVSLFQKEGGKH